MNVLHHLSNDYHQANSPKPPSDFNTLINRLEEIETRTRLLEEYELATALDMGAFKASLTSETNEQRELSLELIKPYIESVWSRLDAISQIYEILDRFVTNVNSFLNGKRIVYKLTKGFSIVTKNSNAEFSGKIIEENLEP